MCEWLSCSEWCDVYLQCGGRVFSAHRAVLASVSNFLRVLLKLLFFFNYLFVLTLLTEIIFFFAVSRCIRHIVGKAEGA